MEVLYDAEIMPISVSIFSAILIALTLKCCKPYKKNDESLNDEEKEKRSD